MSLPHTAHLWSFDLPRRADSTAAPPRTLVVLASEGPECESPPFVELPRSLVSLTSEVLVGALACDSLVSLSGFVCLFLFKIHIYADSDVLPALSITMSGSFPVTPSIFNATHVDWPENP